MGSAPEAHDFALCLLGTPDEIYVKNRIDKKKLFNEAIQYIDYAITAEVKCCGGLRISLDYTLGCNGRG